MSSESNGEQSYDKNGVLIILCAVCDIHLPLLVFSFMCLVHSQALHASFSYNYHITEQQTHHTIAQHHHE